MYLFANAETTSFFPPEFLPAIVMSVIYVLLAAVLFLGLWKFIDWLTPGDLDKELLGHTVEEKDANGSVTKITKSPNVALALVVAALVVGFCLILTAAIK